MWEFPLFDAQGSRRRFLAPRLERRLVREWEGARCQREVFVSGASVVGPAVIRRAECRALAAAAITLSPPSRSVTNGGMEKFTRWFELVWKRGWPIESNSGSVRIRLEGLASSLAANARWPL